MPMAATDAMAIRLRLLHDSYAWEVNAAVGRGEEHLIPGLVDQYSDEALRIITDGASAAA
jgi:hypothetical protein